VSGVEGARRASKSEGDLEVRDIKAPSLVVMSLP
jgi:hypothetical protein